MEPVLDYDHFDPEAYLRDYYLQDIIVRTGYNDFYFEHLNEYFQSGILRGKSMLEIGTGPMPLVSMYAAKYYDEIYLSDFAKPNREFLTEWLKKEKTDMLRPIFEKVAKTYDNGSRAEDLENELREKVQSILHCDMLKTNPLRPVQLHLFDLVAAAYCVEEVVTNKQQMKEVFLNFSNLLKPGGFLICVGDNSTFYRMNGHKYRSNLHDVTIEEITKTLEEAGYQIVRSSVYNFKSTVEIQEMYNSSSDFTFLVQKK